MADRNANAAAAAAANPRDPAASPLAAPTQAAQRPKTGETVTIACKLPNGLFAELIDMDDDHATFIDRNGEKVAVRPSLGRVFFRGVAAERRLERGDDQGNVVGVPEPLSNIRGGYGLTFGVDKEWAMRWFDQNQRYQPVAAGLIFMMDGSQDKARSAAAERVEVSSGLEPIDPANPKKDRRRVGDVEPDPERHKHLAA